jgi:hypothetical protein
MVLVRYAKQRIHHSTRRNAKMDLGETVLTAVFLVVTIGLMIAFFLEPVFGY